MQDFEYADLSEEQKEAQILALVAMFVGLPGVTGAPLIMGPNYYREIAIHMLEAGARVIAEPIKRYEGPQDLRSAGMWVYNDPETAPEDPHERFKRLAEEENAAYLAEVERRKTAKGARGRKKK